MATALADRADSSPRMGASRNANARALSAVALEPFALCSGRLDRSAELHPTGLGGLQSRLGALGDHPPLSLGEGGIDVQHEARHAGAQFRHQERHPEVEKN